MSALDTVDSPDAAATLQAQLDTFPPQYVTRGQWLFDHGRVARLVRSSDSQLTAGVLGSRHYTVSLQRSAQGWAGNCTCPMFVNCKHVAAAALAWLAQLRGAGPASLPPRPPAAPRLTFREHWEPILAAKLGRELAADEGAFLGKLSQIFHNFRQSGSVWTQDLARLGFATNEAKRGHYGRAFEGWWSAPPRDPLALWQYVAFDIESSGLAIPEFMRPITDTAPVRREVGERARRDTVERWRQRFQILGQARPQPAVATALQPLDLRLRLGRDRWALESRESPETAWAPVPRLVLDALRRHESRLSAFDASPAVFAFFAVCHEYQAATYGVSFEPSHASSRPLVHRLLSHPLARQLVTGPAGEPLVFAEAPLVWRLARASDRPRDFTLTLEHPDGRTFPPGALHLPGQPDYYLDGATVFRGPPPLDGSSTAGAIVPAEAIDLPDTLRLLRRFHSRLPAEIETRFRDLTLRARVECALATTYAEREQIQLQLTAFVTDPPVALRGTPAGWHWPEDEAPCETSADGHTIYSFDTAAADAIADQIAKLGFRYEAYQGAWVRTLTRNFPEQFLVWRESLPPDVEVVATGELASLLGAPVRARVDFDLIESAVHRDWFDLALALKPEDSTLTADEIALLLKARGKLVRIPGKGWRRLSVEVDAAATAVLASAGFEADALAESALLGERHRFHALQLAPTALADALPAKQAAALRSRAQALARPAPPLLPAGLRAELRPYQREGFDFLVFLSTNALGGVLADDMGLGKTVQTLAWLLHLASGDERQRVDAAASSAARPFRAVVVCPKSVVGNWESEAARFTSEIAVVRFTPALVESGLPTAPVTGPLLVVANYTQLRLHAAFFHAQPWDAAILDEGQFIKNPSSKVAQAARELPGAHRLVLTGTPIENRLLDLWSLFAFALPGLLGAQAAFKRHYADDNPLALTRLRGRVRHFLLRRTKAQVATDLPSRTEEDVDIELEGEQAKLYQAELKHARAQLLGIENTRQLDKVRFNVLASLLRLRQICCHPALVDAAHANAPSAKLDALMERLEELRDEGHQVLVFSQFVEMLELIRARLVAGEIGHLMLTGATENRAELVAEFQRDKTKTVFLLSLKAAGFGLNLTAASYVFLYDPWWNPAVEAQAIDRTHRIGQTVPVNAYRFIGRGTVEEKIRALQKEKAALAASVVQEESLAKVLDLDSLRRILA